MPRTEKPARCPKECFMRGESHRHKWIRLGPKGRRHWTKIIEPIESPPLAEGEERIRRMLTR